MSRDRGQVVPLMAAFIVIAGFFLIGLAHLGGGAVQRALARRGADAAALAGAAEGRAGAERLADANDARITRYRQVNDHEAEVVVEYGDARAIARATRDGGGTQTRATDPSPALRASLARAAQLLGHQPRVVRARGYVVELTSAGFAELAPHAADAGLCPDGPDSMRVCGST